MIYCVPQPPLLAFAPHKAPHFIHLGLLHLSKNDVTLRRIKRVEEPFVHLLDGRLFFLSTSMTVAELTRRTRTISRTPLPLSVISMICCFTAGSRPLSWYCKKKMVRGQSRLLQRYRLVPLACLPYFTPS